jgi:mono/diheme cytochrome c family protein
MRDLGRRLAPFTAVLTLALGACTGKYIRPTTLEKIDATPDRVARGSYIVNQNASCGACHTTREGGSILAGERTDMFLAGGNVFHEQELGATLVLPNITPDVETGIGAWSDDQIMRAIRDGIGHDGNLLIPMMPFSSYQYMSDEDARAVVAYLRTVPPVKNAVDRSKNDLPFPFGFLLRRGVAHHAPAKDVTAPAPPSRGGDQVKWGEYVARLGHCWECHSDKKGHGPDTDWMFGGGAAMNPNGIGRVYVRNLTPDVETGLGRYSAGEIKAALRNGKRLDGRPMAPPMSLFIPHVSGLADEDMDALIAYLRAQKPIKNKIKERELAPETKKALGSDL